MNADPLFWEKSVLQSVFLPLRYEKERYPGFDAKERLVRAPILQAFPDARAPVEAQRWISQVAEWNFDRIVQSLFIAHRSDSTELEKGICIFRG